MARAAIGPLREDHSVKLNLSPMDILQRAQTGIRLSGIVGPPLDSGILCPDWKSNTLIRLEHHLVGHFPSKVCP
jgi:hypothetical protein